MQEYQVTHSHCDQSKNYYFVSFFGFFCIAMFPFSALDVIWIVFFSGLGLHDKLI